VRRVIPKIAVIGAGEVGAAVAYRIAQRELGEVVMIDVVGPLCEGKVLDMRHAEPIDGFAAVIEGTEDYAAARDADIVVITAGTAGPPGTPREAVLSQNVGIVRGVAAQISDLAPSACIVVVTNPLDVMCHVVLDASGFSPERVMGQSGHLDSGRFRSFLAQELGVAARDVQGLVLGSHTDYMVPLPRFSGVNGIPIELLVPQDRLQEIAQRTRVAGREVSNLCGGGGSARRAVAAATVDMVHAIARNQKRVMVAAAYLQGEYDIENLYLGVPVVLGASGVERIIELPLSTEENRLLDKSAQAVRDLLADI